MRFLRKPRRCPVKSSRNARYATASPFRPRMNSPLSRSSTPDTEPLCNIRFIAESGYSVPQIKSGGRSTGIVIPWRRDEYGSWRQYYFRYFVVWAWVWTPEIIAPDSGVGDCAIGSDLGRRGGRSGVRRGPVRAAGRGFRTAPARRFPL